MEIRSEGIPELQRAFATIGDVSSKKIIRRALYEGAKQIRDAQRSYAPYSAAIKERRYGHLRDTIRVRLRRIRGAAFISSSGGGVNIEYAIAPNYKRSVANIIRGGIRNAYPIEAGSQAGLSRRFTAALREAGKKGTLSGSVKTVKMLHFKIGGKDFFRRRVMHPAYPANEFVGKSYAASASNAMTKIKDKISIGIDNEFQKMVKHG